MTDIRSQSAQDADKTLFDREMLGIRTSIPGRVVSFDSETQLATVQPLIRRYVTLDTGQQARDMPEVVRVPIIQPRAGNFAITMPVTAGDEVMIVVADRSIDSWIDNGGIQSPHEPVQPRHHDITDSVIFLGATPIPKALQGYNTTGVDIRSIDRNVRATLENDRIEVQTNEVIITANTDGTVTVVAPGGTRIESNVTIAGNLAVEGNQTNTGTIAADGTISSETQVQVGNITLTGHRHEGVTTGMGQTQGPIA